jgi:PIN domain nuclease of toxin-antitoxin system
LLRDGGNEHHLSAANLWEIAIKRRLGKLKLTHALSALPELLESLGVKIVAINERHALASVEPEPATRDPFDRMLLGQCQVEGLRLLTIDRALVSHPLAAKG